MGRKMYIIRSAISSMPSVGIIQILKKNGFSIAGTDLMDESAGRYFVDDFFMVKKADDANRSEVVEQYKKIIHQVDAKWIMSGPENEICLLAENEIGFNNMGCHLFHPVLETLKIITDKLELATYFRDILPAKNTRLLNEKSAGEGFEGEKLVLKPRKGRGSNGIFILSKNDKDIAAKMASLYGKDYLMQEYINGKEYSVDVLCDLEGKLLNAVARQRIGIESGISVVSKTVKIPKLMDYTIEIASRLKLKGICCIQFIEEKGDFYLTDINPRIGGGTILSINSADSFQSNFINLLSFKTDDLAYNRFDYRELTMYRYYSEIYV